MVKKNSHYRTDETIDEPQKEEIDKTVAYVRDCWEQWDAHWGSKMSHFESLYDRWLGKPTKREEDWQSDFNKKLSWQAEKTLVARFHSALWPNSAPIDVDSTEVDNDLQAIISRSIVAHWFKIGKFSLEFLKGMRAAGIYGTGLFEDDWLVRKEEVTKREEIEIDDIREVIDEKGNPVLDEEGRLRSRKIGKKKVKKEKRQKEVVEDRYRVQKANIFAWRIHPHKLSDDDNYPVIKQEFITYDDLVRREAELAKYGVAAFENMDEIKKDNFKIKEGDRKRLNKDGEFVDKKNPQLEVLNYWGLYSEDEEKEKKPMWIMIINRKYKVKVIDNPYWHKKPPLFHIVWTEDEKPSYYGIGVVEIGKTAEDRANSVVNIRTDERKKNVKGGGWYNALDKKIKKSHLHSSVPGHYKPCSDVNNAVRPDIPIPSSPDDYKEEEVAVNDHREITGATTSLNPSEDKTQQHDTLGGMKLLLDSAAQRLKPDLTTMEMMGIRQMANRGMLLTLQFMTKPEMIEIIASSDEKKKHQLDKVYELTPGEIIGKVNFFCTGLSESIDKAQNIDKLMKYAEVAGKIPPMAAITNFEGIAKRVGLWLGFEDVEEFIQMNPDSPLQPAAPEVPPGVPGLPPGVPPGLPGVPPPGLPPGIPQGIPPGVPPGIPPGAVPPGVPQGGGLPPEMIQMIIQNMLQSQQPQQP
jgi:hypothetical protein